VGAVPALSIVLIGSSNFGLGNRALLSGAGRRAAAGCGRASAGAGAAPLGALAVALALAWAATAPPLARRRHRPSRARPGVTPGWLLVSVAGLGCGSGHAMAASTPGRRTSAVAELGAQRRPSGQPAEPAGGSLRLGPMGFGDLVALPPGPCLWRWSPPAASAGLVAILAGSPALLRGRRAAGDGACGRRPWRS
jgi:hypothetical protein